MDHFIVNTRIRARRSVVTHISRILASPKDSVIKVSVGQEVSPEDILGESQTATGFRTIPLAAQLGVSSQGVERYLKKGLGQTVYKDELLASKEGVLGFGRKIILVPNDGVLESYDKDKGELKIRLLPHPVKLVSGVYGVVDAIDKNTGTVVIRTMANIVYGVVGSGAERGGILKILGSADTLISSRQINEELSGSILVGGSLIFGDALRKAVGLGICGIITGGINAADYRSVTAGGAWNIYQKKWADVGMSLLVTEGFGSLPIGEDIFNLMKSYAGKFVVMDGNLMRLILPTLEESALLYIRKARLPLATLGIAPDPISAAPLINKEVSSYLAQDELKVGAYVRIISGQFMGAQGIVESTDKTATLLSTGVKTYLVNIATKSRKIRVPYANVEIVCCW